MSPAVSHVEEHGFAIFPNVIVESAIDELSKELQTSKLPRSRAGIRHALRHSAVDAIANHKAMLAIARQTLGGESFPFRATLFDKSQASNWLVVWHQDTALPLRERSDKKGWGPWSVKDGVNYAHAPASALEKVLALRLHLDDSALENGPLKVLPGTHRRGVLSDDQIHELTTHVDAIDCLVSRGGVLAMRPLIVHASSKSSSAIPRRVLHVEYANSSLIDDGMELAIA